MSKRIVDKAIIAVSHVGQGTTQNQTTIRTVPERETTIRIVGNIACVEDAPAGDARLGMAIVIVSKGLSVGNLDITNNNTFYATPENVLWHQMVPFNAGDGQEYNLVIDVRGMRKLRKDDTVLFILDASLASTADVAGVLTYFCKLA